MSEPKVNHKIRIPLRELNAQMIISNLQYKQDYMYLTNGDIRFSNHN